MRNKIKSLILILAIIFSLSTNVFSYTQEIAKSTPYYAHPVTGVIEDPGNNPGIGQGMTENVLNPNALVETTDDGRIFLSVRYNLANYIKKESFAVQNYGEDTLYSVPAEVTAQTEETRDYRFEIPSKNIVVRAKLFVEPMGRDVIFYYTISDLVSGNTDFKSLEGSSTNKKVNDKSMPVNESQSNVNQNDPTKTNSNISNMDGLRTNENNSQVGQILAPQSQGEKIEQKQLNSNFSAGDLGYSHGLLTKDSDIIKKLYYSNENDDEPKEKTKLGKITLAFIYALIGLMVAITALVILLAILTYFFKNKTEEELEKKRSEIYYED
ncbi:ABC transporter [Peptoniphilus sp. MSJ-1]|uniref:ABC transporter n=1 Tax=Peptoniphilus ovalis TaxID=2841503 RepID=A0ABS6FH12_9FIRM|nr:heme-binding Shp domain-containing protein [Peptoniphilus ovalis]MBU5669445.1 ABC transporter [Peptoniphilus ovalis]